MNAWQQQLKAERDFVLKKIIQDYVRGTQGGKSSDAIDIEATVIPDNPPVKQLEDKEVKDETRD